MVEEIVMIDKQIKFDFFYNSKVTTTSTLHCKSTGSRPFAILPLLLDFLLYFGPPLTRFFLPLPVQSSYYPSLHTQAE